MNVFWSHVTQSCEKLDIEPVAGREKTHMPEWRVG